VFGRGGEDFIWIHITKGVSSGSKCVWVEKEDAKYRGFLDGHKLIHHSLERTYIVIVHWGGGGLSGRFGECRG